MPATRSALLVAPLTMLLILPAAAPQSSLATSPSRVAVAPGLFEFHSGFWINLHHFLYVQARARKRYPDSRRRAVAAAPSDTVGFGALPTEQRRGWESALAYYEHELAPRDALLDSLMPPIKNRLGELEDVPSLAGSGLDTALVAALEQAAPAYRALWWPRHDAANRAWIRSMLPLLDRYGTSIARGVSDAFRTPWQGPLRVDVTAYANWAGAYTTEHPSRITISSLDPEGTGTLGLEGLFHESLHTMEDSIASALHAAGRARGKEVPYGVNHALIFYTAGEVTRRVVGTHTPYAITTGLWERSWPRYLPILRARWQPWLDGHTSFSDAIAAIVADL
jgi:hypothetical protein